MNELWKPVAALVLAMVLAVQAVASFTSWEAAGRALVAAPLIVAALLAAPKLLWLLWLLWLLLSTGAATSSRTVTVRFDANGGDLRDTAVHEAGHMAGARSVGGRVIAARVYEDGSGWCKTSIPYSPHNRIVTAYAGQVAEGSNAGAGHDDRTVRRVLATVPSAARGEVWRGAKRATHSAVAARRGQINRDADRLLRKGGRW